MKKHQMRQPLLFCLHTFHGLYVLFKIWAKSFPGDVKLLDFRIYVLYNEVDRLYVRSEYTERDCL